MLMLSSVLVDENSPLHVRNAAGLALKNALSARVWLISNIFSSFLDFSWLRIRRARDKRIIPIGGLL